MDHDPHPPQRISVLDSLGSDIIGVMSPVSICMFLVVLLVSLLTPPQSHHASSSAPTTAATLVYQESPSDPPSKKLEGALLNALVFVSLVAAVTFLLLLLYYYNYTNLLKNYMRFSAFVVLASMGGSIFISLLRRFSLPLDSPTFSLLLLNFAAVGVLAVLSSSGIPILLRQCYMVSLGIIVAAWLTKLPEWTTWTLLMALAIYDLVAVLAPGGPLKLLVELASSRDDDLPAFIYEARPTVAPSAPRSIELQQRHSAYPSRSSPIAVVNLQVDAVMGTSSNPYPDDNAIVDVDVEFLDNEEAPLVPTDPANSSPGGNAASSALDDAEMFDTTRGIKLGLGDFVFYSVLVGRAAMYDWMTVYACYLAIIAGLGCTLILLAVFRKALPALPISVTLGVVFYFLTRLLLEPLVVGLSTNLVMF